MAHQSDTDVTELLSALQHLGIGTDAVPAPSPSLSYVNTLPVLRIYSGESEWILQRGVTHPVGRSESAWIALDAPPTPREEVSCSRKHAELRVDEAASVYLADLESVHGTHVNGVRLPASVPTLLHNADQIRFGRSPITFHFQRVLSHLEQPPSPQSQLLPSPQQEKDQPLHPYPALMPPMPPPIPVEIGSGSHVPHPGSCLPDVRPAVSFKLMESDRAEASRTAGCAPQAVEQEKEEEKGACASGVSWRVDFEDAGGAKLGKVELSDRRPEASIGRGTSSDVHLALLEISNRHAKLCISRGRLFIHDTGSKHGTWIHGRRLSAADGACPLPEGTTAQLGHVSPVSLVVSKELRSAKQRRWLMLDTSTWVQYAEELSEELLMVDDASFACKVVVPKQVVRELDGLKQSSRAARHASRWLADAMQTGDFDSPDGWLLGQTDPPGASLRSADGSTMEADERILGCALQRRQAVAPEKVYLVTEDHNLRLMAGVEQLPARSLAEIRKEFGRGPKSCVVGGIQGPEID